MKNILDIEKYPLACTISSLTKDQARILLDDLIGTLSSLLDVFSNFDEKEKQQKIIIFKIDFIKAYLSKLQSLYPVNNRGWQKFAFRESLFKKRYNLEDIFNLSKIVFERIFSFPEEAIDLQASYFFYVLKKKPERWKEIYLIFQERTDYPKIDLFTIFAKIKCKDLQKKIIREEEDFIIKYSKDLLESGNILDFFNFFSLSWLSSFLYLSEKSDRISND